MGWGQNTNFRQEEGCPFLEMEGWSQDEQKGRQI